MHESLHSRPQNPVIIQRFLSDIIQQTQYTLLYLNGFHVVYYCPLTGYLALNWFQAQYDDVRGEDKLQMLDVNHITMRTSKSVVKSILSKQTVPFESKTRTSNPGPEAVTSHMH